MNTTETSNDRSKRKFHASDVGNSRYFAREDVGDGLVGTISSISWEDVSLPDMPAEEKWVVYSKEHIKGLVLNKVRGRQISEIAGGPSEDEWVGTSIEMYDDPTVEFGHKVTGGIRVRKPKVEAEAKQASADTVADDLNDDIVF